MASKKLSESTVHRSKPSKKIDSSKTANLSAEYINDSDSDEASSSAEESQGSKAKANGSTGKGSASKTKHTSSNRNGRAVNGTQNETSTAETSESGKIRTSQEQEPSSEDSSEGNTSEDEAEEVEETDVAMPDASEAVKHSSRVVVARPKFSPPQGFKAATIPGNLETQSLFTAKHLSGKEIWHIVAPPNVPISSLTTATLVQHPTQQNRRSLAPQGTAATHKGTEYTLVEGEQPNRQRAYQPDVGSESYSASGPSISRVLRLQRKPLSKLGNAMSSQPQSDTPAASSHSGPQQPEGLRMRYQPFGVSSDAHLSRINQPSASNQPSAASRSGVPAKRRTSPKPSTPDPDWQTSPKRRKQKQVTPVEVEPAIQVPSSQTVDVEMTQVDDHETPEERARRKAERRREREERRARKEERRAKRAAQEGSTV